MKARLLLIEDDPATGPALAKVLRAEGYAVDLETRGDAGLARAERDPGDVVVTDLKLPGVGGLELVARLHAAHPRLPIILMTAHGTTETAIEATKLGACEYLTKPFEVEALLDLVGQAVGSARLMSEPVTLGDQPPAPSGLVGDCRAMQTLYKEIGRVAATPVPVLIRGATGTGKELVARALYQHSDRASRPFIAVNCAAIPQPLLESELFGHERGAFTGAVQRRIGRFEQASGGTLFLDEIGDLPAETQAKLLRVLQERTVLRVGGAQPIPVDVRVLAATHCDLETAIREGEFREDLYYRLSVVTLSLPPLRERPEDIPELARHFIRRHAADLRIPDPAIQPEAIDLLRAQPWPGNVRELENVIRQALLLARPFAISVEHLRQALDRTRPADAPAAATIPALVADLLQQAQRDGLQDVHARLIAAFEPELFGQAIRLAGGNQARAARWLGVTRLKMREKLAEFGLRPPPDRSRE